MLKVNTLRISIQNNYKLINICIIIYKYKLQILPPFFRLFIAYIIFKISETSIIFKNNVTAIIGSNQAFYFSVNVSSVMKLFLTNNLDKSYSNGLLIDPENYVSDMIYMTVLPLLWNYGNYLDSFIFKSDNIWESAQAWKIRSKCEQHRLGAICHMQMPQVYGQISSGGINKNEYLPSKDLFIKLDVGTQGNGHYLLENIGNDMWKDGIRTIKNVYTYIEEKCNFNESYLICENLQNHDEILKLCTNLKTFLTMRIVSCFNPAENNATIVAALFRLPPKNKDSVVDNMHAGGSWIPVCLNTGRCYGKAYDVNGVEMNRDVYKNFIHFYIPFFHESISMVKDGHCNLCNMSMARHYFLSFDVGICNNGPVVLEWNYFGWLGFQRATGGLLKNEAFVNAACEWCEMFPTSRLVSKYLQ